MTHIVLESTVVPPVSRREVEYVERKGVGHPDSICDAVMEAISVSLCREYQTIAGRALHHNLDKSLLVAGESTPALGGGTVSVPMRLVMGDRATQSFDGRKIPVAEIAEETARRWFREHLRFVDPDRHLILQNEIRPGSPELTDIFARQKLTANDTSAAVGFAPLSESERIVLEAERFLNSREFKSRHPETGEDIKVMGIRRGRELHLTVAIAFVDRFFQAAKAYFDRKAEVEQILRDHLRPQLRELDQIAVSINTLDDPSRGAGGMYLTVLGTSAEGADGGEVGRGNRVNGLISFNRPMTMEAAAGKNPVSHVGKIYNLLSHHLAQQIHGRIAGTDEVEVWMCSQIGRELDDPWSVSVGLHLLPGVHLSDLETPIRDLVRHELDHIDQFVGRLCRGELPVC